MTRLWLTIVALAAALPAWSQAPVAGNEYRDIRQKYHAIFGNWTEPPVPKGKIEVVEFFAYFCGPCYQMTPQLDAWRKRLGPDVVYRRIPMAFNSRHLPYAGMYYRLKELGQDEAMHEKVYHGMLVQKAKLETVDDQAQFFETLGIPKNSYLAKGQVVWISMKNDLATELNKGYDYHAVPAIGVGGRYVTWMGLVKTPEELLSTADHLIAKARAELPKP